MGDWDQKPPDLPLNPDAAIVIDEKQWDFMMEQTWNVAFVVVWTAMVATMIPEGNDEHWAMMGKKASEKARKAMERAVVEHREEEVIKAAVAAVVRVIADEKNRTN